MPNDYYTEAFTAQPRGIAKVAQIEASLRRIEAAFDKLPALRALLEDRVTAVTATTSNGQAFTVTMNPAPSAYTDGMALNVRFPQASEANPTLDILDANGMSLGAKPIRDVQGAALTAGHIAANVRGELYYVDEGNGYWILGAGGARGEPGPAGPPDGEFYILSGTKQLGFRTTGGTPIHNFGQIAPFDRGPYDAATEYVFLDVVQEGGLTYIHFGLAATTGTAVTDTSVWKPVVGAAFAGQFVAATGVAGTADAITLTPSPAIAAYAAGQRFRFLVETDNTGAATVAVSGLAATAIVRNDGENTALAAGDLQAGAHAEIVHDGTRFLLLGQAAPATGWEYR